MAYTFQMIQFLNRKMVVFWIKLDWIFSLIDNKSVLFFFFFFLFFFFVILPSLIILLSDVSLPVARPRQPRCHHVEDLNSRLTMSVSTVEPMALCCLNCQVTALTLPQICWPRPVPRDRRGLFNHRTLVKLRKFADFWPSYFIHWPSSVDPDTDSATNQSDGFTVSHPSLPSFVNKNGDPARVDS